ncbi:mariner Mos1 transposase [Trichonephila clavipes]|uniref:Mariner Mos1 transposase n=1 Tax=Trichonephila clavipes TaxID=2585209 RepID=A0A8X7BEE0_TRICX|nr:mariner Mos1 transposase [Trichonephila clavipes]
MCTRVVHPFLRKLGQCVSDKHLNGRLVISNSDENIEKVSVTFFDRQDIAHKEFLPEGTTMNAVRYTEVLTRFMKLLRKVRPQYAQNGHGFLFTTMLILIQPTLRNCSEKKKGAEQVEHPPYSPYLNPSDFFLFPQLKLALK